MIALARSFVCVADEVWRLQRGSEADCVFFQRMVNGGERITDRGTRQGVWVCAAGGVVLARGNARNPDAVLAILERGLQAWEELSDEERRLPGDAAVVPTHRWEQSYPEGGLVLERIARDLSEGAPRSTPAPAWNRDFAWFSAPEVAAMVPETLEPGDDFPLPALAQRLARFHLVDNVRGQTLPYAPSEVLEATLVARVVRVEEETVELTLAGRTRALARGPWLLGDSLWKPSGEHPRALGAELLGEAVYDRTAGVFRTLELVGVGARLGRTENNGRRGSESGEIGFHLSIAPHAPGDAPGARVAPAFVALYDAEWIERPAVPTWVSSPHECGLEGAPGAR